MPDQDGVVNIPDHTRMPDQDGVVNIPDHTRMPDQDGVVEMPDHTGMPSQDTVVNFPDQPDHQDTPKLKRNSINYFSLPYNPALRQRARELRKAGNLAEVLFWKQVRNKSFKGLDFDRQKIIGNYIVDFYCPNCQVVVEIDGASHNDKQEYDAKRDEYLQSIGLTVFHFTDYEVKENIDAVMNFLDKHPALNVERLSDSQDKDGVDKACQQVTQGVSAGNFDQQLTQSVSAGNFDHPVLRTPLQRRGISQVGYKSSGGKMVWCEELGKEVPEGWEVLQISDIGEIKAGGDRPNVFSEIKTKDCEIPIYSNGITNDGLYGYTNKHNFPENSITISARGTIGFCVLRRENFDAIVRLLVLIPNHQSSSLYLWQTIKQIEFDNSGSVQNQLTIPQIAVIKVLFPELEVIYSYNSIVSLIYQNSQILLKENQKLTELKELLLSKLATIEF
jgi:very-short-patch-repair endonuclease